MENYNAYKRLAFLEVDKQNQKKNADRQYAVFSRQRKSWRKRSNRTILLKKRSTGGYGIVPDTIEAWNLRRNQMFVQMMEKKKQGYRQKTESQKQKKPQFLRISHTVGDERRSSWGGDKTGHDSRSKGGVIQARVERYKPSRGARLTDAEDNFERMAQDINVHLEAAYNEFMEGDYTGAEESYVNTYLRRKINYEKGEADMHPSTAAGYVIESKVSRRIEGNEGIELQPRHVLKGTRPDIELSDKDGNIGLLDITAENSIGHIFLKKGNWTGHSSIIYVAELLYPSIDFRTMKPVILTEEQKEELRSYETELQIAFQERRDACEENFVENRNRIFSKLINFMCLNPAFSESPSSRQEEIVRCNFQRFGITIDYSEGRIKNAELKDISFTDDDVENYHISDMDRCARTLMQYIMQKKFAGMMLLWP